MDHFDVLVIGTGSGNTIIDEEFAHLTVAIAEAGRFGGTCLNVGCIPTKMYVHAADIARDARESAHLNISTEYSGFEFAGLQQRVFDRIDAIEADGRVYRSERMDNVTVFPELVHFTGPKEFQTASGTRFTADRVVLATGSSPTPLEARGLDWSQVDTPGYPVVTSNTVMRLPLTPKDMVIVGSGFIALEFAHVFASLGVNVTVLARHQELLRSADAEVSRAFTEAFSKRVKVRTGVEVDAVEITDGTARISLKASGSNPSPELADLHADTMLVAVGRTRASAGLNPAAAGIDLDGERIVVDEYQRVLSAGKPLPGVFALGDVCSPHLLKHVANHEARVVRANLLADIAAGTPGAAAAPDLTKANHAAVPAAVFSRPQVATVGATEDELKAAGVDYVSNTHPYAAVAYGWALDVDEGFVKVLADRHTHQLLGAHIMGPEASMIIQTLIHAMSFNQTIEDVARGQYWIHPALNEVVENALLGLKF